MVAREVAGNNRHAVGGRSAWARNSAHGGFRVDGHLIAASKVEDTDPCGMGGPLSHPPGAGDPVPTKLGSQRYQPI
jgi:hypothetical protein